ncbi:hypothetical protein OPT61_g2076 [Boeremia exigua]|uniref:Uncharacterized protein n=1 Tax=Boeremia exigua TaxID=749465 RepID=A0ACC2IMV1_9PLEO|nr:hypothetical protein OPT61_g2076 [Boeremia exigua]
MDNSTFMTTPASALTLITLWVVYLVASAIYNISPRHPLSHVPGPKLAAMSLLYEFWFDMVLGGTYTHEIRKMHESCLKGPVVRIGPNELHCNDPAFTDEIYASSGRKRNKQTHNAGVIVGLMRKSSFGSIDHDLHRMRRNAINKFFSRAQITKLEPEMKKLTQTLCDKLLRCPSNQAFEITTAYSCFSTDVISAYCFGKPIGFLEQAGWEPNFREPLMGFFNAGFMFRYFPWTRSLADAGPLLAPYLSGEIGMLLRELYIHTPKRVAQAMQDHKHGVVRDRPTVFNDLLASSLPGNEKTIDRLSGEAFSLTGAGTETTAWTLSVITFYVLSQPAVYGKLMEELESIDLNDASWHVLEKLPYLNAVISEGLRLSYGVASRTPRVASQEHLVYRSQANDQRGVEIIVPKGTAIGMSAAIMHHNETIFPYSDAFEPERWLGKYDVPRSVMEKNMMPFSKGSRQCVGMNLAYCELFLTTAALMRRVFPHIELFQTTVEDVKYDHDAIIPRAKKGSKGVRVVVK